ncbi:abortive infection bacteriophage resistance protein [Aneurinibacillus soli]|uniref:Abi-like protein n=1 Tax=Aneurinibacillus soli TaxID=1500254 RepID=A0A0U4WIR3_9BACL|nr:Abi family protein [Aneurinibacillus soli]PYE61670.1 abortive infection bacteriophage resistance protein [Aneurinibacillus soli]BAU28472.1 Abi-like protein [Aneurinibacillus soli]
MSESTEQPNLKPPLTYEEQLNLLKIRGLVIKNDLEATEILKRVNYYRLKGYMLSLKQKEQFFAGISFEHIFNLYEFDRKLRNILIPMLENIEIAFRTDIAYLLAHKYGSIGYKNRKFFQNEKWHAEFLSRIDNEVKHENETFITHHKIKYNGQLPAWVMVEVLSFGALSMLFHNLHKEDQKQIAQSIYYVSAFYIKSWLRCLSYIRNVCAHYGRLYNKRKLIVSPKLFDSDLQKGVKEGSVFSAIYIMRRLCRDNEEWHSFVTNLHALLEQYEDVKLNDIGFPDNWYDLLNG